MIWKLKCIKRETVYEEALNKQTQKHSERRWGISDTTWQDKLPPDVSHEDPEH